MLQYILFECCSTQFLMLQYIFFDAALYSFAMLQYLYHDVALHSSHIFCDVAFEVFCTFRTGEQWGARRGGGTECIGEQGHGRGGEQRTGVWC
jgi:hypothetical protein